MSGFTDPNVVFSFTGATKFLYSPSTSDYRFKLTLPEFSPGNSWGVENTKVVVQSPSGSVAELQADTDPDSEAFWDDPGSALWVKPDLVISWAADLSDWKIYPVFRPPIEQVIDPIGLGDLDPAAQGTQLDRTTRLAQTAFEMAQRAMLEAPSGDFTGREAGTRLLLPPKPQRAGKVFAWDEDGNPDPVHMDPVDLALDVAGKADQTYVDAQLAAIQAAVIKSGIEYQHYAGHIDSGLDWRPPTAWDPAHPWAYYPALDLASIVDVQVIDSVGTSAGLNLKPITKLVSPPAVAFLRAFKATVRRGMATEKSAFALSTAQVSGGTTLTLVFASDADLVAALAAWNEDALVAGASADLLTYTADYTKSWVLNIPTDLINGGTTVPAGDYIATSVTASTKTVVVTIPATANSGPWASAVQCSFFPFRYVGDTTKARVFASQGRVLQGANDGRMENISGGRRRGRFQGHTGNVKSSSYNQPFADDGTTNPNGASLPRTGVSGNNFWTVTIIPDGLNGPPRTGPETDSRSTIAHFALGLGGIQ